MLSIILHSFSPTRNLTARLLALGLVAHSAFLVHAARYLPGKYSGIVVFDRWDNCFLMVNHFQLYISEDIKEQLREYTGKCIEIRADDLYQPSSSRPARINAFEYLGLAPKIKKSRTQTDLSALKLSTHMDFSSDGKPCLIISARNQSLTPITLFSDEFGITLIRKKGNAEQIEGASNGSSFVLAGGHSFEVQPDRIPRLNGEGMTNGITYHWNLDRAFALPHSFLLGPHETRFIKLDFEIPDGHYDFLSCYGGQSFTEQCLLSNQTFFDVNGGNFEIDEISGAFGYRLGDSFNISDAVLEVSHKNGLHEYRIKPVVGLNSFDTYAILITPETKKIFQISASAAYDNVGGASQMFKSILNLLRKYYRSLNFAFVMQRSTGLTPVESKLTATKGTKSVSLLEDSNGRLIRLMYFDRLLHAQAKREAFASNSERSIQGK